MNPVKKYFWPVFIIVFIIVAVFIGKTIYDSMFESQMSTSNGDIKEVETTEKVPESVFTCENDNSVQSRGYVYLHGLGDHNPEAFDYQRSLINNDHKTKGILDFDYDESLTLNEISNEFIEDFNKFASENDFEEIIILGQSAGGVIASFSAHKLIFSGDIELHTMASPINGYHVSDAFLGDMTGFGREIGKGFGSFVKPPENVKVYHHKTVDDEDLRSWCGDYSYFCDPDKVQDNNIEGSKEFFYPDYNHTTIMSYVSKLVIDCHK